MSSGTRRAEACVGNAEFVQAIAERLPFPNASFEIVTTRLAAHHFDDVALAFREVARVLRPGGAFIFVDTLAPEARRARPTRTRSRRCAIRPIAESTRSGSGIAFCDHAGLRVAKTKVVRKAHVFEPWLGAARMLRPRNASARASLKLQAQPSVISRSWLPTDGCSRLPTASWCSRRGGEPLPPTAKAFSRVRMHIKYHATVDAAYIYLVDFIPGGGVAKTYPCDPREVGGEINLDFDSEGRLLGIDVLDASKLLPAGLLNSQG